MISPTSSAVAAPSRDAQPLPLLSIDLACEKVDEVSTLPHVAMQIIRVARDPEADAADMCAMVEGDPALSARVLKCVNSAAYCLRNRVTNLQRAISLLGFKQVRNLAVTASVSRVFKDNQQIGSYTRPALWRHMVSVAIAARMIATRCEIPAFEEAFLAGLLHDIGIILEDQYCHDHFVRVMEALTPERTLVDVETDILGFDHTRFGTRFAEACNFPEEACNAIRFHHSAQNYRGSHEQIIACVDLANLICTVKDCSSVGMKLVRSTPASMQMLNISTQDVKIWATDLDQEISQNKALFKL